MSARPRSLGWVVGLAAVGLGGGFGIGAWAVSQVGAAGSAPTRLVEVTWRPAMVVIPPGEFWMGSPENEPGRFDDEKLHRVRLTRPFALSRTEVLQGQWRAVLGANPSRHEGAELPVENVNWYSALAYANAVSKREGLPPCYVLEGCTGEAGGGELACERVRFEGLACTGYRLPTEAEWEYAARAGTTGMTPWGKLGVDAKSRWRRDETQPPGKANPEQAENAFGLIDMFGNVTEWTMDEWTIDEYQAELGLLRESRADPLGGWSKAGAYGGDSLVIRGCSFGGAARYCRAGFRGIGARYRVDSLGFRLSRSIEPSAIDPSIP